MYNSTPGIGPMTSGMGNIFGDAWDKIEEAAKQGANAALAAAKKQILKFAQGTDEYKQLESYIIQQKAAGAQDFVSEHLPLILLGGVALIVLTSSRGRR